MQNSIPVSAKPWKFYVLYSSVPRGWNPLEKFHIEGKGWRATFLTEGPQIPLIRMKGDETINTIIDRHPGPCVEIIVDTNEIDLQLAIKFGKPNADIIAAILTHKLSSQIINRKIWTGLMGTRNDGSLFLTTGEVFSSWDGAPTNKLKERATEVSTINLGELKSKRPIIVLSYRWFLKGLSETDVNDKFISLWLSAVALYTSYCDSQKDSYSTWLIKQKEPKDIERNRIRFYVQNKLKLSGNDNETFYQLLSDSYDLRIKLFHESQIDIIKESNNIWLTRAVSSMLWVEMGFQLGGSPAILVKDYLINKEISTT